MTGIPQPRGGVLAVAVLFERNLEGIESWDVLSRLVSGEHRSSLKVLHVLIYDNSAKPKIPFAHLPDWTTYVHCPENGGTAAAYRHGAELAQKLCYTWLLLLDQDTRLPVNFLDAASDALDSSLVNPVSALLPRVKHGAHLISPARIGWYGSLLPISTRTTEDQIVTGIASGALLRVNDLLPLFPLPHSLWLDYVDHYIFVRLQQQGKKVRFIDIELQHDLSVKNLSSLSAKRLESILDGERVFYQLLSYPARMLLPFRWIARALRLLHVNQNLAFKIIVRLWKK